ncbi:MAG: biotin transporter BioY [Chthonomonadetes bacterium]|nr:biotin transporter BioY [Chthonomonadetes bacterium]
MNRAVWQTVLSRVATDKLLWVQSVCFALLTAWGARCSVPLPYTPVPVTLQTLFVLLSGMVLGARWGAAAQAQYLLMGFLGLPVFAAGGGFWYLFNPRGTGGYLLAYPLAAYVVGAMVERTPKRTLASYLLAGAAGTAVIHAIGATWLATFLHLSAVQAVVMGVVPFLLGDAVKIAVAALCARGVHWLSSTVKQGDR